MPLSNDLEKAIKYLLIEGEGFAVHLYLCSANKVTVGVGKMTLDASSMDSINMYKKMDSKRLMKKKERNTIR